MLDGCYVFFVLCDGWIIKFDMWNLKVIVEVCVGINICNVVVFGDGKWVVVVNYLLYSLVIFDVDFNLKKILLVVDKDGKMMLCVLVVYDVLLCQSFVVVLKDVKEFWEILYNLKVDDILVGMIYDFKYCEGVFIFGFFNLQCSQFDDYFDDFYFIQGYDEVMGVLCNDVKMVVSGQVVNFDVCKKIVDL